MRETINLKGEEEKYQGAPRRGRLGLDLVGWRRAWVRSLCGEELEGTLERVTLEWPAHPQTVSDEIRLLVVV